MEAWISVHTMKQHVAIYLRICSCRIVFRAMNISGSACASAMKSILCAACNPFSANLFTVESGPAVFDAFFASFHDTRQRGFLQFFMPLRTLITLYCMEIRYKCFPKKKMKETDVGGAVALSQSRRITSSGAAT